MHDQSQGNAASDNARYERRRSDSQLRDLDGLHARDSATGAGAVPLGTSPLEFKLILALCTENSSGLSGSRYFVESQRGSLTVEPLPGARSNRHGN